MPSRAPYLALRLVVCCLLAAAAADKFEEAFEQWESDRSYGYSDTDYEYSGTPRGLKPGATAPTLLTVEGCINYVGSGHVLYPFEKIAGTITTWVLPLAGGILLQAPYESNNAFLAILLLLRWLGNPIASLTSTFRSVYSIGRCALIVDMATPRDHVPGLRRRGIVALAKVGIKRSHGWWSKAPVDAPAPDPEPRILDLASSENERILAFAEFRNSLYILSVLSQYHFEYHEHMKKLLKHALFFRPSQMMSSNPGGGEANGNAQPSAPTLAEQRQLVDERNKLANLLRTERKRGVVLNLISLMWFFVAFVLSVITAFGDIGDNSTAHNLAIGLLMMWLPVFIASSIVDRNSTNAARTAGRLREFLGRANRMLPGQGSTELAMDLEFCGQARRRFQYGAPYKVILDVEISCGASDRRILDRYIHQNDILSTLAPQRLTDQDTARLPYVISQLLYSSSAALIVLVSITGAFMISYNTPTVGLGCRSGGYMIYGILSVLAALLEFLGWGFSDHEGEMIHLPWHASAHEPAALEPVAGDTLPAETAPTREPTWRRPVLNVLQVVIGICEIFNAGWLVYIIVSQTFGLYNSCECKGSTWGALHHGGYIDIENTAFYHDNYVLDRFWISGTMVGAGVPILALIHLIYQWCVQSFLWTEDYQSAARGLRRTRRFKRMLFPFHRLAVLLVIDLPLGLWLYTGRKCAPRGDERRSTAMGQVALHWRPEAGPPDENAAV